MAEGPHSVHRAVRFPYIQERLPVACAVRGQDRVVAGIVPGVTGSRGDEDQLRCRPKSTHDTANFLVVTRLRYQAKELANRSLRSLPQGPTLPAFLECHHLGFCRRIRRSRFAGSRLPLVVAHREAADLDTHGAIFSAHVDVHSLHAADTARTPTNDCVGDRWTAAQDIQLVHCEREREECLCPRRICAARVLLGQRQRDRSLQSTVQKARMQGVPFGRLESGRRQAELRDCEHARVVRATADAVQAAKRRPVSQAKRCERGITTLRLEGPRAASPQLRHIDRRGLTPPADLCPALRVESFLTGSSRGVRAVAVDLEGNVILGRREQTDVDRPGLCAHDKRTQPRDIPQGDRVILRIAGSSASNRGVSHFQVRDPGQHTVAQNDVLGEEELIAREDRSETLSRQVRRVELQQRVQRGRDGRSGAQDNRSWRRADPVSLAGKRVGRQGHAPRTGVAIQVTPLNGETRGPDPGQFPDSGACQPMRDELVEIPVDGQGIHRTRDAWPLSLIAAIPPGRLVARKRIELFDQLRAVANHECHAARERLAADLQRESDVRHVPLRKRSGPQTLAQPSGVVA